MQILTLSAHGLSAKMMPWGAVLMDLRLEGHEAPLVLGFDDPALYPEHSRYFGATAGRVANRIGHGQFTIDGQTFQADQNFMGRHMLHGGAAGIGKRIWDVVDHGPAHVQMQIGLSDGEMGFPGNMVVKARFSLEREATFRVVYTATTDAPTLCNLAHHTYWCLDDTGDLSAHHLQLDAGRVTEVDADFIPTGRCPDVAGTRYDFRAGRPVLEAGQPIDHNLCLSESRQPARPIGRLWSAVSGISMGITTTEPGIQVYDGAKLDVPVPGLGGRGYGAHAGLALEPQIWPDAINHSTFPSPVLRPGETYEQITEFRFSREETR